VLAAPFVEFGPGGVKLFCSRAGLRAGCDQEGRTTALPFRSQERFGYHVWTTDGYSGTRRQHRDRCDRECSPPLPNEFHRVLRFLRSRKCAS
jgi:hypothetical protein